MKSDLAVAALIRSRMTELGLSRGEFAKRLRYACPDMSMPMLLCGSFGTKRRLYERRAQPV
jgi:hypothetical protein